MQKKRGYTFELTEEQFAKITKQNCFYCGAKPNNIKNDKGSFGAYTYNGIDRIDNNKGYVIGNIVSCCKKCNRAKDISNLKEYKNWIKRSYNKMFGEEK